MHRTQILLEPQLYRRALEEARVRDLSLGEIVRTALRGYLDARVASAHGGAVEALLLENPFDGDDEPDPHLSEDVDHYLYGAPRKSASRPRAKPARARVKKRRTG
jgi:hypothetical protein